MKLLLDVNVILDVVLAREPRAEDGRTPGEFRRSQNWIGSLARKTRRLKAQAAALGYTLLPVEASS